MLNKYMHINLKRTQIHKSYFPALQLGCVPSNWLYTKVINRVGEERGRELITNIDPSEEMFIFLKSFIRISNMQTLPNRHLLRIKFCKDLKNINVFFTFLSLSPKHVH